MDVGRESLSWAMACDSEAPGGAWEDRRGAPAHPGSGQLQAGEAWELFFFSGGKVVYWGRRTVIYAIYGLHLLDLRLKVLGVKSEMALFFHVDVYVVLFSLRGLHLCVEF